MLLKSNTKVCFLCLLIQNGNGDGLKSIVLIFIHLIKFQFHVTRLNFIHNDSWKFYSDFFGFKSLNSINTSIPALKQWSCRFQLPTKTGILNETSLDFFVTAPVWFVYIFKENNWEKKEIWFLSFSSCSTRVFTKKRRCLCFIHLSGC